MKNKEILSTIFGQNQSVCMSSEELDLSFALLFSAPGGEPLCFNICPHDLKGYEC